MSAKPKLFVSYSWDKDTMEDVRKVAQSLIDTGLYDVWIDINNMQNESINAQMAKFVKESDLVLIFFNNYYQSRPNCQKEAILSDKYRRNKLFIYMQPSEANTLEAWFDAIILDQLYIDYYKEQNGIDRIMRSVAQLLKQPPPVAKAPVISQDDAKQAAFFTACCEGDTMTMQTLLNSKQVGVNAKYDYKKHGDTIGGADFWNQNTTPLMFAAWQGQLKATEMLLKQPGILVNEVEDEAYTALSMATEQGYEEIAALLKKHGATADE